MFNKFCRWLDSNRRPLVSEAAALPTQPQPLPTEAKFVNEISDMGFSTICWIGPANTQWLCKWKFHNVWAPVFAIQSLYFKIRWSRRRECWPLDKNFSFLSEAKMPLLTWCLSSHKTNKISIFWLKNTYLPISHTQYPIWGQSVISGEHWEANMVGIPT